MRSSAKGRRSRRATPGSARSGSPAPAPALLLSILIALFCSLPLDLGVPFGGFDPIGGGVAVLLWLYLFHVIVLAGYSATLALPCWRAARAAPSPDVSARA